MITQEELKILLTYNLETGIFTWNVSVKGSNGVGNIAGTKTKKGYIDVCINYKKYGLHRLAFLYVIGNIPRCVDHIDRNKSNNSWLNLRPATYRENGFNYKGIGTSTGFKNVYQDKRYKGNYFVQIVIDGKPKRMGTYKDLEFANIVAIAARKKYCKDFACD